MTLEDATSIAVVDDDRTLRETLADGLRSAGFRPLLYPDARSLVEAVSAGIPHGLILLDLALPDEDGLTVAVEVRRRSRTPIIMLTGRGGRADRIEGFETGADDYVVKPFDMEELLARVRAVLRRTSGEPAATLSVPEIRRGYAFAGRKVDLDRRRLLDENGCNVSLTVAEFDLLNAFLNHSGRLLSRERLLDLLPGANEDVFDRTIDVLVLRLRRKVEPNPSQPQFIRTERGRGYLFTPAVTAIGSQDIVGATEPR